MTKLNLLSEEQLHSAKQSFIPQNIDFNPCLVKDKVKKPLKAPYSRPYKVISRHEKYFIIKKFPQKKSLLRLKPMTLLQDHKKHHLNNQNKVLNTQNNYHH